MPKWSVIEDNSIFAFVEPYSEGDKDKPEFLGSFDTKAEAIKVADEQMRGTIAAIREQMANNRKAML